MLLLAVSGFVSLYSAQSGNPNLIYPNLLIFSLNIIDGKSGYVFPKPVTMYTSTSPVYNIPLYTEMENAYRHIKSKSRISYDRIYQLIRYFKVNLNFCLPKLPFRDLYMKNYCVHCYGGMIACRRRLGVCVSVECLWTWLRTRLDLYYNALFLLAFVS